MWQYISANNRYRLLGEDGRHVIELEVQQKGGWRMFHTRKATPSRSLLIGKYPSLVEAKAVAENVLRELDQTQALHHDSNGSVLFDDACQPLA